MWVLRHTRRLEAAIPECAAGLPGYDAAIVTAAACFHDAVYEPSAADNEERSARLAETQLASLDWPAERCAVVADLVRATAGHLADGDVTAAPARREEQVLLDADLAVLGADPAGYAAYVTGVRGEYAHLSTADWATGRANVLERLLARRSLYLTEPARSWWVRVLAPTSPPSWPASGADAGYSRARSWSIVATGSGVTGITWRWVTPAWRWAAMRSATSPAEPTRFVLTSISRGTRRAASALLPSR